MYRNGSFLRIVSFIIFSTLTLIVSGRAQADDQSICSKGKAQERIDACSRLISDRRVSPSNRAISYFYRGTEYGQQGDEDRAIADFGRALDLKPDFAPAFGARGTAHTEKGQFDEAIRDFDAALRLQPNLHQAYSGRGRALLKKGHADRAIADQGRAIELKPDFAAGYGYRADAYATKGRFDNAIRDYDKAIELDPRVAGGYVGRGRALEQLGRLDEAKRSYRSALAVSPRNPKERSAQDTARKRLTELDERERSEAEDKRKARSAALEAATRTEEPAHVVPRWSVNRLALVIGNSAYANAPRLNNPPSDAKAVAKALRRVGFTEVIERYDLGIDQLGAELKAFGDKAANADWAVVYYAGHGIQVDGRSYLIPVDASLTRASHVEDEALALDRVLAKVADARKIRLVILDACRSNPFLSRMIRNAGTRSLGRGLALIEHTGGVLVAYAARDGQLAQDGTGENSPYTAALLEHLEQPGLEIGLLFRKVRDSVLKRTGGVQEPWTYGSIPSEELYFKAAAR